MLDEAKIILQHKYIIIQSIYTGTHVTCRQELNERLLLAVWWWQLPLGISRRRNNTSRPLRQRPMSPPIDAPNMKHRDGSMAGLCGHWARRRRICRRQALPRYVDFEAPGISTCQREVDIGAAVEGWRATTPERAKAMTPVGTIWREISLNARQNWNLRTPPTRTTPLEEEYRPRATGHPRRLARRR